MTDLYNVSTDNLTDAVCGSRKGELGGGGGGGKLEGSELYVERVKEVKSTITFLSHLCCELLNGPGDA